MSKSPSPQPIEIKISTVVAVSAILRSSDLAVIDAAMTAMTGGSPDFFDDEFAVIDVSAVAVEADIDWAKLVELLKKYRLNPVAVRGAAPAMVDAIRARGLSLDEGSGSTRTQSEPAKPAAAPVAVVKEVAVVKDAPATAVVTPGTMIIDTPVRAGQRIYARGCDLIVAATVNNGAEIIADGSIHVYAALYGRALAGASGNAEARIFALSMQPELVSIAGVYRTFDEGFPAEMARQPAQVRLVGDRIDIMSIASATRT